MSLEDESMLSAYLDGELADADHRALERLIQEDPRLQDQLAGLTVVRTALSTLPRPARARDAAPSVIQSIERGRRSRWRLVPRPVPLPAIGVFATAIAALLAVAVGPLLQPPARDLAQGSRAPDAHGPVPGPILKTQPIDPANLETSTDAPVLVADVPPTPPRDQAAQEAVRRLLEQPGVSVLQVSTPDPAESLREVRAALVRLHQTTEPSGLIRVQPDPVRERLGTAPNLALVVSLTPSAAGELAAELNRRLPGRVTSLGTNTSDFLRIAGIGHTTYVPDQPPPASLGPIPYRPGNTVALRRPSQLPEPDPGPIPPAETSTPAPDTERRSDVSQPLVIWLAPGPAAASPPQNPQP